MLDFPGFVVGFGAGVGVTFLLGQLASYYGRAISLLGQQEENEDKATEGSNSGPSGGCMVCYEKVVDCVLYTCGHICMCYHCAIRQWGEGGGFCPICENEMRDVVTIYKL